MSTPALLDKGSPGSAAVPGSGGRRFTGGESVTLEELRIDSVGGGGGGGGEKKVCSFHWVFFKSYILIMISPTPLNDDVE